MIHQLLISILWHTDLGQSIRIATVTLSQEGMQPQGWALQDVLNDSLVCYQDLSEYVGLSNIE